MHFSSVVFVYTPSFVVLVVCRRSVSTTKWQVTKCPCSEIAGDKVSRRWSSWWQSVQAMKRQATKRWRRNGSNKTAATKQGVPVSMAWLSFSAVAKETIQPFWKTFQSEDTWPGWIYHASQSIAGLCVIDVAHYRALGATTWCKAKATQCKYPWNRMESMQIQGQQAMS